MLKALELNGFKSFADRTRFEFPQGITAVVGPNGSGKSNVVDAIKWVLGEQSVKSLRGKEMSDVIFNGSGARRAVNAAEVTLTFDNSGRLLAIDADEVHITRRVYRSGEGEYLINKNPARLRDIRDLLSGTGMGTQAYSVIEQGKVDGLLQASPKDRRLIFEEAAGISRFKIRKLEAARRLERVDQNLVRLRDIVDEVDARLRAVRAQAGKAKRYKELSDRLQELRTQVGLSDWRRLSEKINAFDQEIKTLSDQRDAVSAEAETKETDLARLDGELAEANERIRGSENCVAADRERIASAESTVAHELARIAEYEQDISRRRRLTPSLGAKFDELEREWAEVLSANEQARASRDAIAARAAEADSRLAETVASLEKLRAENERRRAELMERMRESASLGKEISSLETQHAGSNAELTRCVERLAELDRQAAKIEAELTDLRTKQEKLSEASAKAKQSLDESTEALARSQRELTAGREALVGLKQRRGTTAERAIVLEEFVRRQEGISAGVKETLTKAKDPAFPAFQCVHGLVADLFNVSVEAAPLIEIALGPASQHVVAKPSRDLIAYLHKEALKLAGRVGFVWYDPRSATFDDSGPKLDGKPGVLGRADRYVETEPRFAPLAKRLLAGVWIVENLLHALRLAAETNGVGFITMSGEYLQPDGTLVAGPRQAATGIIARRSELRALRTQIGELDDSIEKAEEELKKNEAEAKRLQEELTSKKAKQDSSKSQLAETRFALTAAEEKFAQIDSRRKTQKAELDAATAKKTEAERRLAETARKRGELESALALAEQSLAELQTRIEATDGERVERSREATEIKVELAKTEERSRSVDSQLKRLERNRRERQEAIADNDARISESESRVVEASRKILRAETELADLHVQKENYAARTAELAAERETIRERRAEIASDAQRFRGKIKRLEEKLHAQDLAANEVRHERASLSDRLREDYGIELAEIDAAAAAEPDASRENTHGEIEDLRQKLNSIGAVNLESLEELEQLETRFNSLSTQYQDLVEAKTSLEKIIEKINVDSRRLFQETFEAVRGHFQQLFRDLFGGGAADVVPEEGADILEGGIEIVARPPGKEPRSISLLSGGEKTLTCVALLLAIFRNRPSPFCVLDEVDAALDEANIDRFTKVLHDFLAWTQFIIITHSKKTMTCANSIYGVTMQESGISKQVSVRFEDVTEDGHILPRRAA